MTIATVGNSGDYAVNQIGLQNLAQKINLKTLGLTGSHGQNIVGAKGGDVTIGTVGNSGDYSTNVIGLQNLRDTIKVDTVHSGSTGGGTLVGTKGKADITVGKYIVDGQKTHDTFGKKGNHQNFNVGNIVANGKNTVTDFWLI